MAKLNQRRLIRKLDLERFLNKVKPHPSPNVNLEQYTLSESTAATMLRIAAYTYDDIVNKRVLDLGCGTGRLALGAAFLGAESVVGVDIDKTAIKAAFENSVGVKFRNKVDWISADINAIVGKFDTVIQNPPFGVQKRGADRRFIEKALELGCSIYSLHNHPIFDKKLKCKLKGRGGQPILIESSQFMTRFAKARGGTVESVYALPFVIPHMFDFHTKPKEGTIIDLYVIKRKASLEL